MNLTLTRTERRADGIFGVLTDEAGKQVAVTLEHAYPNGDKFEPKIPNGTFRCVRGPHRLHGMDHDFTTFEITGVAGHSNLLFHWGNFNKDSEGCVLLGVAVTGSPLGTMITSSKIAFDRFMKLQEGLDSFQLTVKG